jgi:hypothetical protein
MARYDEGYDTTPANNTGTAPDGAPEGMSPGGVNDSMRQTMAAIADIGEKVLGPSADEQTPPALETVTVAPGFMQIVYDALVPVGTVRGWDSRVRTLGTDTPITIQSTVPAGVVATWVPCDGSTGHAGYQTGSVPDYRDKVVAGGDPLDATPANRLYSGAVGAAGKTSADSAGTTDGHRITLAQMHPHAHGDGTLSAASAGAHEHSMSRSNVSFREGGGQAAAGSAVARSDTTRSDMKASSAGAHTHDVTGSTSNAGGGAEAPGQANLHSHAITGTHDHDTGQPPRTYMEFYVRVA